MKVRIKFDQGDCPSGMGADQLMDKATFNDWLTEHAALLPNAKVSGSTLTWTKGQDEDGKDIAAKATVSEHPDDFSNV